METLKIFKTHEKVELPKFATEQSACFDISYQAWGKGSYTGFNKVNGPFERQIGVGLEGVITITPGDRVMIPTGLIFDIPKGYSVRLHPRSGLSLRHGLVLANCEAVIDSDYFQELFILITNTSDVSVNIHHGERLAQAEMVKDVQYAIVETVVQPTQKTDRVGGLGSTGVQQLGDEPVKRGRGRPKKVAA